MTNVIYPLNLSVSQLLDEGDGISQALVILGRHPNAPYVVHLNDEQASDLYYQLQRIRNLKVQAALLDTTAHAINIIKGENA